MSRPPVDEPESRSERAVEEYATLGFTLSLTHPLMLRRAALHSVNVVPAEQLHRHVGKIVTSAGVIVAERRYRTPNGRLMIFASLCDQSGVTELTLFEDAAQRYAEIIHTGRMLISVGTITQDRERGIGMEVRRVRSID